MKTLEIISFCVILAFLGIIFGGCAPRNAEFCYNQYTNDYVKCPSGYTAGDIINIKPSKKVKK